MVRKHRGATVIVLLTLLTATCTPFTAPQSSQKPSAPLGPQALLSSQTREQYLEQLMGQLSVEHMHFVNVGVVGKVLAVQGSRLKLAVDPLQISVNGQPAKTPWVPSFERSGVIAVDVPSSAILAPGSDLLSLLGEQVIVGGAPPSGGRMTALEVLPMPALASTTNSVPTSPTPGASTLERPTRLVADWAPRPGGAASSSSTANFKFIDHEGFKLGYNADKYFGPSQCGGPQSLIPAFTIHLQAAMGLWGDFVWPMQVGLSRAPTGQLAVSANPSGSGTANVGAGVVVGLSVELSFPCLPGAPSINYGITGVPIDLLPGFKPGPSPGPVTINAQPGYTVGLTAPAPLDGQTIPSPTQPSQLSRTCGGLTVGFNSGAGQTTKSQGSSQSAGQADIGIELCVSLTVRGAPVNFNTLDASGTSQTVATQAIFAPMTPLPIQVYQFAYSPIMVITDELGLSVGQRVGPGGLTGSSPGLFSPDPPHQNYLNFAVPGPFYLAGPGPWKVTAWQHLTQSLTLSDSTLDALFGKASPPVIDPDHGQILAVLPKADQNGDPAGAKLQIWSGSQWSPGPLPSTFQAMAYDPARHQVIALSEQTRSPTSAATSDQTWGWDGSSWQSLNLGNPVTMGGPASLVYEPSSQSLELVSATFVVCCGGGYAYSELPLQGSWRVVQCGYAPDPSAPWQSCGVGGAPVPTASFDQIVGLNAHTRSYPLGYDPRLQATLGWDQSGVYALVSGYWKSISGAPTLPAGSWAGAYDAADGVLWIAGYAQDGDFHLYRDDAHGGFQPVGLDPQPNSPPTAQPLPAGLSAPDDYLNGLILPNLWAFSLAYDPTGQQLLWLSYDNAQWTTPLQQSQGPAVGFVSLRATTWTFSTYS